MALQPEVEKLRKELGLDMATIRRYLDKIAWRRKLKKELRGDFDEKYPEDPISMFLAMGRQFFDKDVLIARKRELIGFKPYQTLSNGEARIFWPRVPGRRYIIGADPATGRQIEAVEEKNNTDYCAAVVIDMETEEEMGAYRARVTPPEFAADLDELGRYFNYAPIAVERTGDGATVILELTGEYKYPSIARFKEWHRRVRGPSGQMGKTIEFEGFPTTPRTRPHALNLVNEWLSFHPEKCWDSKFIDEALVFVRDERGIPSGANGTHDDTVAARWIALGMRAHLLGYWNPGEGKRAAYISADRMEGIGATA